MAGRGSEARADGGGSRRRLEELVFGLGSEVEEERKLCLTWLAQVATPEVLPHIERMTADPSLSVRYLARQLAGQLREKLKLSRPVGEDSGEDDPVALLVHADPKTRLAGAMLCYEQRSPELCELLFSRLDVEPDAFVRASIVKALRHYAEVRVVEKLAECLLDPDARVRANTIEALMVYEHPALFSRISNLLHDPDNRVRGTVLVYLAKRKPEKIRPLLEVMTRSEESWARVSAHYALRTLGWAAPEDLPEVGDASPPSDAGTAVREMFAAEDFEIRIQAVWRALKLDLPERFVILRERLEAEEHPHVVATLARSLGYPGMEDHLPLLEPLLAFDDPRVRANSVEGIARVGGTRALSLLEPMLEDASPRVRAAAALHLALVRRQRSLAALRTLLDSSDNEELAAGLHAIAQLPEEEGMGIFRSLAQAWEPDRRQRILFLLQDLTARAPMANWMAMTLSAMSDEVRAPASGGRSGEPEAAGDLENLASQALDSDPGMRIRALERLAESPSDRVASILEMALQDREAPVSEFASHALVRVQNQLVESRVLGVLGAEAVRLWEAGEFTHEAIHPLFLEIRSVEDAIALGTRVQDQIHARHRLLIRIGKDLLELVDTGVVDHPAIRDRVESVRRTWQSGPMPVTADPPSPPPSSPGADPDPPGGATRALRVESPPVAPREALGATVPLRRDSVLPPTPEVVYDAKGDEIPLPPLRSETDLEPVTLESAGSDGAGPVVSSSGSDPSISGRISTRKVSRRLQADSVAMEGGGSLLTTYSPLFLGVAGLATILGVVLYGAVDRIANRSTDPLRVASPRPPVVLGELDTSHVPVGAAVAWPGRVQEVRDSGNELVMVEAGKVFRVLLSDGPTYIPEAGDHLMVRGKLQGLDPEGNILLEGLAYWKHHPTAQVGSTGTQPGPSQGSGSTAGAGGTATGSQATPPEGRRRRRRGR